MKQSQFREYAETVECFHDAASHVRLAELADHLRDLRRAEATLHRLAEAACERDVTLRESQTNASTNARLLAAAPDLLEACKLALEKLEAMREKFRSRWPLDLNPKGVTEDHLQSAIAKAEGTSL